MYPTERDRMYLPKGTILPNLYKRIIKIIIRESTLPLVSDISKQFCILANCSVEASNLDIATGHFGCSEASILDSPIPENIT